MREGARRVIITVSALALIGITAFCISGTVHSSEKVERREREKYYREIEAEYVKEVRVFLNEEGYSNSGVTMTKVIDEEENRSYTMTIHHRGIGNLQQEEQEQHNDAANKAQLFANNGKNKICMIFRQKVQLALSSFKKPLPYNHAGANSNL